MGLGLDPQQSRREATVLAQDSEPPPECLPGRTEGSVPGLGPRVGLDLIVHSSSFSRHASMLPSQPRFRALGTEQGTPSRTPPLCGLRSSGLGRTIRKGHGISGVMAVERGRWRTAQRELREGDATRGQFSKTQWR